MIDSSQHVVPGQTLYSETTWDSSAQTIGDVPWLTVFANFMLVPRGETVKSFFTYELPAGVVTAQKSGESVYRLIVQKQPGMKSELLTVTVTLPEGVALLAVAPAPTAIEGAKLIFATELDSNQHIMIRYR